MSWWAKVAVWCAAVLVIAAVVCFVLVRDRARQRDVEQQATVLGFIQTYGAEPVIISIVEPSQLHVIVWESEEGGQVIRHWTMQVDGLYYELGARPVER